MPRRRPASLSGLALLAVSDATAAIPFLPILRELHALFDNASVVYAVVGGVAVARAGGFRTTGDIDVLVRGVEWRGLAEGADKGGSFRFGPDWAEHRPSGVPIDTLFAGDDWDLPFELPDPTAVREWDEAAGAWFMRPVRLVELKAAVYNSKRREYGDATAARDLADLRSLLQAKPELGAPAVVASLHPSVREIVAKTTEEISRYRKKRPRPGV
ncbi:MAG: hypothetical protein ACLFPV_11575 [Spirochaetaceae bacterium]